LRVLIAEDDAVSRKILQRAVERFGHQCICARDGNEAWEIFKRLPDLDVVISDWMMPEIDGIELCSRIRAFAGRRDGYPYFVFMTAFGERDHYLIWIEAGADDYLTKPLCLDELRARLLTAERVTSHQKRLFRHMEDLRLINRELFKQARQDPLTCLGNRLRLREDLDASLCRMERYGICSCVALCDIDSFKTYNGRYGHLAGDEVLRKVARTMSNHCRGGDTAYRYGGDEFLLILPEQSLTTASVAADRLRRGVETLAITNEAAPKNDPAVITLSIGLTGLVRGQRMTADALLEEADLALYRAKRRGGNRIEAYVESVARTQGGSEFRPGR
jgi:two-component system cell cycle response regulator